MFTKANENSYLHNVIWLREGAIQYTIVSWIINSIKTTENNWKFNIRDESHSSYDVICDNISLLVVENEKSFESKRKPTLKF